MKFAMVAAFILVALKQSDEDAEQPRGVLTGTIREIGPHCPLKVGDVAAFKGSDELVDCGSEPGPAGLPLVAVPLASVIATVVPDAGAAPPPAA